MKYNFRDIGMTEEYNQETGQWEPGDILLSAPSLDYNYDPIGDTIDIATKRGYENLKQILIFRFLTNLGDYALNKGLGSSFDKILGRRISKGLIEEGKTIIRNIITYDRLVESEDVEIIGFPLDKDTVVFNIAISNGNTGLYKFNLIFDSEEDSWRLE